MGENFLGASEWRTNFEGASDFSNKQCRSSEGVNLEVVADGDPDLVCRLLSVQKLREKTEG